MDTKTARETLTSLEKLLGEYASEVADYDLECLVQAAECAQAEADEITEEERVELAEDEEFDANVELREALEAVEEAFGEVLGAIEKQRTKLDDAEIMINKALGCDLVYDDAA